MADPRHFGGILDAPVISFLEAAIVHQAATGLPAG
ncbi:hypothetical protein SAMN05216360_1305 [Methylobacterium phyllostachyos]|uniref:Uncharacterized protein n=1 Tax=Methylobacterium phyllostachyos TaxID=582672 RepID=A0A1H0L174_9HYPH|nr:hypothetical protein SAMN05216360_1305 [Methylobacterium phyllostachyos]